MAQDTVLVTGGTGFLGSWCLVALLTDGYLVRTTVRSAEREAAVRALVAAAGADAGDRLDVRVADLTADEGWGEAVRDVQAVLHVASPFPAVQPKDEDEDELISPARGGTLRVLRAARDAGVRRVVLTSSFAAIGYGHLRLPQVFTEADWTDISGRDVTPYVKSKTLAERAAWDFIERDGDGLELAVVNPVGIMGPALGADLSSSVQLMQRLLNGSTARLPRSFTNVVDVRDVADLHVRAMRAPDAAGQRFLSVAGDPISFPEIAAVVRDRVPELIEVTPGKVAADWLVRAGALFDPSLRQVAAGLGLSKPASNEKARRMLGWEPRSREDALEASARSLLSLGLVGRS